MSRHAKDHLAAVHPHRAASSWRRSSGVRKHQAGRRRAGRLPAAPSRRPRRRPPAPVAVFKLEDNFLQWRLLPSEKQYEAIDGKTS